MHLADLKSYLEADQRLRDLYADPDAWARKAILNVAASGKFSSDRTIAEYAAEIWKAAPCPVELTQHNEHLPSRRQTGPKRAAGKRGPARTRLLRAQARPRVTRRSWLASAPADTAAPRCTALSPSRTSLRSVQAICDYRRSKGTDGPLYMGKDTHALSACAQRTALEVLAANDVQTIIQRDDGVTPTPVISRAILVYNRNRKEHLADGIVITPSHNPPEDGGLKYNPTNGGPAESDVTKWIQDRANEFLRTGNHAVKRQPFAAALKAATTRQEDFVIPYVNDLRNAIDMEAIRGAGLKLGVDPLGGAALPYWEPINSIYRLDIKVVNPKLDPTFSFMTVDHDGKIRMDCSSPYAMASLVRLKDQFRVAFANDPDSDRHGIVTPSAGLMNPNHYLAVAIRYLLTHRPQWPAHAAVGKTLVSSSMIDRVVAKLGRRLAEVPVGFKWFAPGLFDGSYCFGGEESAGASFLRLDGTVWTTDKDGPLHGLAGGGDHCAHRQGPGRALPRTDRRVRHAVLHAHRRARHARAESCAAEAFARSGQGLESGGRAHHRPADPRARQQRSHRRLESRRRQRLVCRPAFRHRKPLQDLRRELPRREAPGHDRG